MTLDRGFALWLAGAFAAGAACAVFVSAGERAAHPSSETAAAQPAASGPAKSATSVPAASSSASNSANSSDFPTRLHNALHAPNTRKRWGLLNTLADDLNAAQISDALAEVEKLHIRERPFIVAQLLTRWAQLDPDAALKYASAMKKPNERNQAVAGVISGWAEKDPKAAEDYVTKLAAGPMRDAAYQALIGAIAQADPNHALALVQSLPGRVAQQSAYPTSANGQTAILRGPPSRPPIFRAAISSGWR